jgi:hypothetical protein
MLLSSIMVIMKLNTHLQMRRHNLNHWQQQQQQQSFPPQKLLPHPQRPKHAPPSRRVLEAETMTTMLVQPVLRRLVIVSLSMLHMTLMLMMPLLLMIKTLVLLPPTSSHRTALETWAAHIT